MSIVLKTDLFAPMEIWEVPFDQQTIKFKEPLILTPKRVPDDPEEPEMQKEYLQIICPELAIDVFAENRDDLLDAVYSNIRMNWKHFVLKEDRHLTSATLAIKNAYLQCSEVVDG